MTNASLKAKPTAIELAVLATDPDDPTGARQIQSDQRETRYLIFDANVLSEIEEHWGGMQEWQSASGEPELERDATGKLILDDNGNAIPRRDETGQMVMKPGAKPIKTLRDTLAIALGMDFADVGRRIIPSEQQNYMRAIGIAFAIANGADPTEAATAVNEAIEEQKPTKTALSAEPAEPESNGTSDASPNVDEPLMATTP